MVFAMTFDRMVMSLHFGRHFWLDDEGDLLSCPTFKDGTPDLDMWDYVSEWDDTADLNLDSLLRIHKSLLEDF
tara:strand:+ start:710 stop:928 length:219 start_codon:yes stop_codon:yes gene_type:complete